MLKLFPLIPERCIAGLQPGTPRLLHVYDGAEMYPVRVIGTGFIVLICVFEWHLQSTLILFIIQEFRPTSARDR